MSVFKKIPELDWLKELSENAADAAAEQGDILVNAQLSERIADLYRYLLWSQRYRLGDTGSPMGRVCNGMLTKYYRRLFPMTLTQSATDYEKKFIAEAEAMRKQMLKAAKHG